MRANVSITVKFPVNKVDLLDKLSTVDLRLSEEIDSPVLHRDELLDMPSDQPTELFVTHAYGIDAIRNAKHAAHLIQEAGGEAIVGKKTVTVDTNNPTFSSSNGQLGNHLKRLIEAKKLNPDPVVLNEITFASKTYDEAEDRVLSNRPR